MILIFLCGFLIGHCYLCNFIKNKALGILPGSLVVKTSPSSAEGTGLIPGREAKISHASQPKIQNINNRSNIVINSIKTLKMGHIDLK